MLLSRPQQHKAAAKDLKDADVEYFLPLVERRTISCGHVWRKRIPVFGRYIFFVVDHEWERVFRAKHVSAVVMNAETLHPQRADTRQVESLRSLCGDHDIMDEQDLGIVIPRLNAGDLVTARSGSFRGMYGRYSAEIDTRHEAALFDLLGKETRVVFKRGLLEAVL